METITQTNRTILFAEINPERLNLLTLVGDVRGKSSLDDDKIKEINEELLVSSFEEFLEKFTPVVYSWCDAATGTIQYSLTRPENIPYTEKDRSWIRSFRGLLLSRSMARRYIT